MYNDIDEIRAEFREPFNISYDNIHISDAFLHAIDGRGLIIAGYPGVGKSSIAHAGRFIDLESSMFRDAAGVFDECFYVKTAIFLASQGYHPAIFECMKEHGFKPNLELEISSIVHDLMMKECEKNDESGENQEC